MEGRLEPSSASCRAIDRPMPGLPCFARCSSCARCSGRRPVACSICVLQLKPSATTSFSRRSFAQARPELMLIDLHREIVFVFLKTEAASHAAAAVVEDFGLGPHGFEELFLGVEADDRLLVAMSVNQRCLRCRCGRLVILLASENSASVKTWPCRRFASWSCGRRSSISSRNTARQLGSRPTTGVPASMEGFRWVRISPRSLSASIKESVVVERPAATEWRARHDHAESGVFQHFRRGGRDFGMKVVVERIGPENDLRLALITRSPPSGTTA